MHCLLVTTAKVHCNLSAFLLECIKIFIIGYDKCQCPFISVIKNQVSRCSCTFCFTPKVRDNLWRTLFFYIIRDNWHMGIHVLTFRPATRIEDIVLGITSDSKQPVKRERISYQTKLWTMSPTQNCSVFNQVFMLSCPPGVILFSRFFGSN